MTNDKPRPAPILLVSGALFTFISSWRAAAVVLCNLGSTVFYIGGIVERHVGPAAPWFILAVLLFGYAVRSVYIESCALFVRGGVYRVVKEALGGSFAKLSVAALLFDYLLTGPVSAVAAGHYLTGFVLDGLALAIPDWGAPDPRLRGVGAVAVAGAIILYSFRRNLLGTRPASGNALRIVQATGAVGAILLLWGGVALVVRGPVNPLAWAPDLAAKPDDPLGFLPALFPGWSAGLREPGSWVSLIGLVGLLIAFGHAILALSGEETLAQVYRDIESPKLPNLKKTALIVFVASLAMTGGLSFLAGLLVPDAVRMRDYGDNPLGGLAMHLPGPPESRLLLHALVAAAGVVLLSAAANAATVGCNGVLHRVAEEGLLPEALLRPHRRYGTAYRLLGLVAGLQLLLVLASRGNLIVLAEAYAFGVVWSFAFRAVAMLVLRFKHPGPREYRVPFNVRIGGTEWPAGLGLIALLLVVTAVVNLVTKEFAAAGGLTFTALFVAAMLASERYTARRQETADDRPEPFTEQTAPEVTPALLGLRRMYRKLVALRSPRNTFMLDLALAETDPETTGLVVMTGKVRAPGGPAQFDAVELDRYDRQLMTAVLQAAERAGKEVKPLVVPTNNPLYAVLRTAKDLEAQELLVGASNVYTADEQLEQIAFYWISLHDGQPAPLTVRIVSRDREVHLDLGGGNRIPKISERRARSVAELRAAGVGVDRVLLVHDGSPACSDLFRAVLTLLDPQVALGLVPLVPPGSDPYNGHGVIHQDEEQARRLGRTLPVLHVEGEPGPAIVRYAREGRYDLIVLPLPAEAAPDERSRFVLRHAHCRVFLAAAPRIPEEIVDK